MISSESQTAKSVDDPLRSQPLFDLLPGAQAVLDRGFAHLPPFVSAPLPDQAEAVLAEVAERLHDNFPYAHPLYCGQMLKPPHPVARAAYALAMGVNPNNHARDGGRASSAMELEAVAELARMFGLPRHLGHLSSGGTFANLEALWVAGQLRRDAAGKPLGVAASAQAHYTHARIAGVLGLPFVRVPVDRTNRMDLGALEQALESGTVGTVVATLGTTATGAVDPLEAILRLRERFDFRLHVDAAYGGYFTLAGMLLPGVRAACDLLSKADSIVIDPHKHGLQPYGCGCILFADPAVGRLYQHDSPYTYFTSGALHLGEISLECSRAGAAAVALWTTQRLLPLVGGGVFAAALERSLAAAAAFDSLVRRSPLFHATVDAPQLDIVVWAVRGGTVAESSQRAQALFDEAARHELHLALARLPVTLFPPRTWPHDHAAAEVLCLRSVLMKPEHLEWIPEIWVRLERAASALFSSQAREDLAAPGLREL